MSQTTWKRRPTTARPPAATAVGVLAALGVIGAIFMALAHSGLDLPLVSALGAPRIVPVAVGFAVGAVLFGAVAWAALTQASWAWPFAVATNGIAFASSVMPWRGINRSGLPALVTLAALALLASRNGREALPYRRRDRSAG